MNDKQFVFLSADILTGISKTSGNPYELHILHFADPTTYENHSLNFKKGLNLTWLKKGDRVTLELELVPSFGNQQSRVLVTDVLPVK